MEKHEILKWVGSEPEMAIVAFELDVIESFAASDDIPYGKEDLEDLALLGIQWQPKTLHNDGKVQFVKGSLPAGWTRTLNKERDWRIDLHDRHGKLRGFFKYKPMERAYCKFYHRYEIGWHPEDVRFETPVRRVIQDNQTGELVMDTDWIDEGTYDKSRERAIAILEGWLDREKPSWLSVAAYWDR